VTHHFPVLKLQTAAFEKSKPRFVAPHALDAPPQITQAPQLVAQAQPVPPRQPLSLPTQPVPQQRQAPPPPSEPAVLGLTRAKKLANTEQVVQPSATEPSVEMKVCEDLKTQMEAMRLQIDKSLQLFDGRLHSGASEFSMLKAGVDDLHQSVRNIMCQRFTPKPTEALYGIATTKLPLFASPDVASGEFIDEGEEVRLVHPFSVSKQGDTFIGVQRLMDNGVIQMRHVLFCRKDAGDLQFSNLHL
jgi:hypothetical protein